jgi:hypothetical protein
MLFIKFPLGLVSFVLVIILPLLSAIMTLLPLVYLLNLFIDGILVANGIHSDSYLIPFFVEIHNANFDPLMFARSFVSVPVGIVCWFVSRSLLNGLAQVSGLIARALLVSEGQHAEDRSAVWPLEKERYRGELNLPGMVIRD